ncbi:DUF2933 domain-containing protein [Mesorhizobium sp. VNQ89]|jgi:hypothetical protein|uniref:DUF2933 domain-containing protein n=1 Tax=Mesorhizobium quangtriensis TaxID=3157709 RepID=UPI0032B82FD9
MNPQAQHPASHPAGHEPEPEFEPRPSGFWTSKAGLVTIGFLLIAAFFLLSEHRAHALGVLPILLLAACPLLHMFMHSGHQGHGSHGRHTQHKEIEPGAQNGSKLGKGA